MSTLVIVNSTGQYLTLVDGRVTWMPDVEQALRYDANDPEGRGEFMAGAYGGRLRPLGPTVETQALARADRLEAELVSLQEATRADLIAMRQYVIRHGVRIGECVAWNCLKARFGTDRGSWEEQDRWLEDYRRRQREATS